MFKRSDPAHRHALYDIFDSFECIPFNKFVRKLAKSTKENVEKRANLKCLRVDPFFCFDECPFVPKLEHLKVVDCQAASRSQEFDRNVLVFLKEQKSIRCLDWKIVDMNGDDDYLWKVRTEEEILAVADLIIELLEQSSSITSFHFRLKMDWKLERLLLTTHTTRFFAALSAMPLRHLDMNIESIHDDLKELVVAKKSILNLSI